MNLSCNKICKNNQSVAGARTFINEPMKSSLVKDKKMESMKHSGVEMAPKPPVDDIYGAKGATKNRKNSMNVYSNDVEVEKLKAEL